MFRGRKMVAAAPARQASPQVPKLSAQARELRRPAELVERDAEQKCPEEPGAKADAGIEPDRCPSVPRGGNGEHARSEIGKVALHDEAGNHGKRKHGDVGQHRGEAEQTAGDRRQHKDQSGDGAQAVTDRELVADQAGGDAKKTDHRSDHQNDPGLRGISGLIAGAEGEEDDNPLPQSDAAPDRRGVADDQGEDVPVCQDRAKVEQRLGIVLAVRNPRAAMPPRQSRRRRRRGCRR